MNLIHLYETIIFATLFRDIGVYAWNYEEQDSWPTAYPNCGLQRQSPIDFRTGVVNVGRAPSCLQWIGYSTSYPNMVFTNNNHTISIRAGWDATKPPTLMGGPLTGSYYLAEMHWHWGSTNWDGSEHSFNSRKYAAELHMVHYNSKFATLGAAVASNEPEALAVVGFLYKASIFSTPGVNAMMPAIDNFVTYGNAATAPSLLLSGFPVNFPTNYFTYQGSLTTPSCQQIVRWIVSKRVMHIKKSQLNILRKLNDAAGKTLSDNYRKVQSLFGRVPQCYKTC